MKEYANRGLERADQQDGEILKRWTTVNGKRELLPDDPFEVVRILKERRSKSPAARARAKMVADAAKRGLK